MLDEHLYYLYYKWCSGTNSPPVERFLLYSLACEGSVPPVERYVPGILYWIPWNIVLYRLNPSIPSQF